MPKCQISAEIWEFLIQHGITITVEHLAGKLNMEADLQSRSVNDSSEWKLNPSIFQDVCHARWTPSIDLFASRHSHQVPRYVLEKRPIQCGKGCISAKLDRSLGVCFLPFSLIPKVLKKVQSDKATLLLITLAWQTQAWYPKALQLSVRNPLLLPKSKDLLMNHFNEIHPLVKNLTLQLVAWTVSGNNLLQREFQKNLPNLLLNPGEKVQSLITTRPGESGIAGVMQKKLIHFDVL